MMRGIKQSEVAGLLNVRQQSVSKIENGKIQISKQMGEKIARYFGFDTLAEMEGFYESHLRRKISKALIKSQ